MTVWATAQLEAIEQNPCSIINSFEQQASFIAPSSFSLYCFPILELEEFSNDFNQESRQNESRGERSKWNTPGKKKGKKKRKTTKAPSSLFPSSVRVCVFHWRLHRYWDWFEEFKFDGCFELLRPNAMLEREELVEPAANRLVRLLEFDRLFFGRGVTGPECCYYFSLQ